MKDVKELIEHAHNIGDMLGLEANYMSSLSLPILIEQLFIQAFIQGYDHYFFTELLHQYKFLQTQGRWDLK